METNMEKVKGLKNGKKPLSSKKNIAPSEINPDFLFQSALALSPALAKALEEKGLEPRFVHSKILARESDGYHPRGWRVFKAKDFGLEDLDGFKWGHNPDGVIRRGDCVLAVKSKEAAKQHRQWLKQKADRALGQVKQSANELRKMARNQGVDLPVLDGYEENT